MTPKTRPIRAGQRRPIPQDKDRTKFDKWLERMRNDISEVTFCFAIPPTNEHHELSYNCHVVDVDRYNLLLEFPDGQTWWINKSIITSASPTESV